MNAILTLNRINFYTDTSRNGRWYFSDINIAVNDAIYDFIDEMVGDPEHRDPRNLQFTQVIRENLQTLIDNASPTITTGTVITNRYYSVTPSTIPQPATYYTFLTLSCLIDGYTEYARPTNFNEKFPLFEDSFKHPSNKKPYFNETASGLVIYRGVGGTFTSCNLEFIRNIIEFTIGTESNLIDTGGTLTNALVYLATQISVYNGTTYAIGASITGTGAALTSGQVIPNSVCSPIDLPEKTHEEICKRAAVILLKQSGNYPASQATETSI